MSRLTTTSYALLGQLYLRPWSAYELTRRMRHSAAGAFWTRTASRLYEEPKNLVRHGLAECSVEQNGCRQRTIYRITESGRSALRAWLSEPAAPLVTEFEGMLKVAFSDATSPAQLQQHIRRIRDQVTGQAHSIRALAREVADLGGTFPERAHIAALTCDFLARLMQLQTDWASWADEFVGTWPARGTTADLDRQARDLLKKSLRTATRLLPKEEVARNNAVPPHTRERRPTPAAPVPALTPARTDWAPWS